MMNISEGDLRRLIAQEVKKQVNIILSGAAGNTTTKTETIEGLFPGMDGMVNRPVAHPYGVSSRAPRGTISVTARQGEHAGSRIVLGHRDVARPDVEEGEFQIYNQFGQAVYLKNGSVHVGTAEADNPAVLGNELKQLLADLITILATHTHPATTTATPGNSGTPGTVTVVAPAEGADMTALKSSFVDNDAILSNIIKLLKG